MLKQKTIDDYETLLRANDAALKVLSDSLSTRIHQWAHDNASLDLQWQDQGKSVRIDSPTAEVKAIEGLFKGDLARFGHGFQRSFIFALLQELSEHADTGPKLILGCEEPELYQHPPQARHLATVLQRLSTQNAEVVICTHSPYFISGRSFEQIRICAKDEHGSSSVRSTTFDKVALAIANVTGKKPAKAGGMAAKIEQEMESSINEMFFASFRVFVEGLEDVAYVSSYLSLIDKWDEFRSMGGHLVPVHGKNHLIQALAISNELHLPYFVLFDCDGDTPDDAPNKPTGRRKQHENDNMAIFALANVKVPGPFPDQVVKAENLGAWPTKIADIVQAELGPAELSKIKDKVRSEHGINLADMDKNGLFIGYVMAEAWEQKLRSRILTELCEAILQFGSILIPKVKIPLASSAASTIGSGHPHDPGTSA